MNVYDFDPRYDWHEVRDGTGKTVQLVRGDCRHLRTEPVTAGGGIVAYLCLTCDAQLPTAGAST